jgi:hypothetical protein
LKKQKGIILLTTVIFLSLIMLLLVAQAELITLHYKTFNHYTKHAYVLHYLEKIASRLINKQNIGYQSDCLIEEIDPNTVITLLKNQKKGCVIADNKFTYIYLNEYLGQFNCLRSRVNGVAYSTRHWRLTIALLASQSFFLQLRIATLAPLTPEVCKTTLTISPGILSWRYLT